MNNPILQFFFTTPIDAGANTPSGKPEQFHFWVPWIAFCAILLLLWGYYELEGRKRFFGGHTLHKNIASKLLNQLALIAFVGPFLMLGRLADSSLFSWRIWRYGWLVWLAVVAIYWLVYFVFRYRNDMAYYKRYRTMQKYMPSSRGRRSRRARSAAGVR